MTDTLFSDLAVKVVTKTYISVAIMTILLILILLLIFSDLSMYTNFFIATVSVVVPLVLYDVVLPKTAYIKYQKQPMTNEHDRYVSSSDASRNATNEFYRGEYNEYAE